MDECEWTENDDDVFNLRLVQEYKAAKEMADNAKKRSDTLKGELIDLVEKRGYADHNGHLWYEVGDFKLKRERRVTKVFNSTACTEWAKEIDIWDDVKEVIEVLSEDRLLALAWDQDDIQRYIQTFYEEKEVWAFKV